MNLRGLERASRTGIQPIVLACCLVPANAATAWVTVALAGVPQPAGYRTQLYDDMVPDALDGATRVTAVEVRHLMEHEQALVIDVIPAPRKPDGLPRDQLWLPVPHKGVPGALWLPDTGFGDLSATTDRYFRMHLELATSGDRSRALIFYCRMNCWMSWNAAKRALNYGYTTVYWFADGLDDWRFESYPLEVLEPAPGQRHRLEQNRQ